MDATDVGLPPSGGPTGGHWFSLADSRILDLIRQMLKAGIMEDAILSEPDEGTPQGGVISPLLANIFLNELDHLMA